MKLPNFLFDGHLNALRAEMGAALTDSFKAQRTFVPIDLPLTEILRDKGLDVDFHDILKLRDGTLGYKGHRVLLYIRDVATYDAQTAFPKFHIAYCAVLERMRQERRFQRYVVANRDDGKFLVNLVNEPERSRVVPLDVCQICLGTLDWKGFNRVSERESRRERVWAFSLQEFFEKYPRDLISVRPEHTTDTAPLNEYTDDWPDISEQMKKRKNYVCEGCGRVLSPRLGKFLHVHHRNGLKYDNAEQNLSVLCIKCHAEEPMHGHIKALPAYGDFISLTGNL